MSDSDSDSMPSLVGDSSSVPEDPDNEDTEDTEDSDFNNEIRRFVNTWKGKGKGKGKGKDQDQGEGNGKSAAQGGG